MASSLKAGGTAAFFLLLAMVAAAAEKPSFDRSHALAVLKSPFFAQLKPAFGRGINLGNALDAPQGRRWGVVLKEEYFQAIAAAGFDSVRIPVRWASHAASQPPYQIDPQFFARVDWAVRQALGRRLVAVLDNHHDDALVARPDGERARFLALWRQIGQHYQDFRPPWHSSFSTSPATS